MASEASVEQYAKRLMHEQLSGADLANLEKDGTITKGERRKIIKLAARFAKDAVPVVLSQRQQHRLAVKEKKSQPRQKLSADERKTKFTDADEQEMERKKEASNFVICLGCRKRGHFLVDCPQNKAPGTGGTGFDFSLPGQSRDNAAAAPAAGGEQKGGGGGSICFNCGSPDHALRACIKPRVNGKLPFATCFICKEMGHLSRDCPSNNNGLYPQGGNCHVCGSKDHFVKDCPQRTEEDKADFIRMQEEEKERKEALALGPKFKGLTEGEDEDFGEGSDAEDEDDDDSDGPFSKKRKSKKDKSKSKKHKKDKKSKDSY